MPKKKKSDNIKNITIDTDMVIGFQARTFPLDKQLFNIQSAEGYEDADGNFVPVKPLPDVPVIGKELADFMSTKLSDIVADNPNITMYEALQNMMYLKI